ncbi:unnamed protein product [Prunus armeniaca]
MVLEDKPEDIDDKQWTRINLHACGAIRSFLDKELKYPYMKETPTKELWKKLEEKYMTKNIENRLFLKKRLFRFQYRPANLDMIILDEDKTLCLLNSLPNYYDHLTTTLLYGKFESRGKFPAKDECAFCHQKGHWKKECPKLKNKENEKASSKANIVKSGDDDFEFALASSSVDGHSKEWILDLGYTYHMCPIREWFSSFEELDGGVVLMGNNNACKTQGICKIYLKMHDGAIRELSDARCVPDMKKNLISLGALESKGLKITMVGRVLKAVYGALVGSTVIGGAVVTEAIDVDSTDTTRLWHMHFRHASEKALQGLVKQDLLKGAKACKLEFCEHCVLVCQDEGIVRHFTVRETPQQNGVAERMNRNLLKKVRCMLSNDGLGKAKSKLDPRAKKVLFMGFSTGVKGYRLWCPDEKKFVVSRDVTFDKAAMVNQNKHEGETKATKTMSSSKQVELLKTLVVPVRSDVTDTSPIDDSNDEDEDHKEEASTQEPP